jgi:tRNA A-37 threonylcarbamoyl transferase component Bud32
MVCLRQQGKTKVENLIFSNSWGRFFSEFGLKSLDDFFEYTPVKTIGINNKRNVVTFDLVSYSHKNTFFMKRFSRPHFKDMLFTWRNFGFFCSQAQCEWENANLLLNNGIETYHPVCYGEQINWGIEKRSILVTEKLSGRAMTDFVKQKWHELQRETKEEIIAGLGEFVQKIHAADFSLPDLYLWHIFIEEDKNTGRFNFAVIDLHRMSRNVQKEGKKIKNLGRLHYSMVNEYFDEDLKRLLIESYAKAEGVDNADKLLARVIKESQKVSAKRNPKPY